MSNGAARDTSSNLTVSPIKSLNKPRGSINSGLNLTDKEKAKMLKELINPHDSRRGSKMGQMIKLQI
jgi:hypothetical protein